MNGSIFTTCYESLAAMLVYSCGYDSLESVTAEANGKVVFSFHDGGTLHQIKSDFFAGAGVSDAKSLLEIGRKVRFMAADAHRDFKRRQSGEVEREAGAHEGEGTVWAL